MLSHKRGLRTKLRIRRYEQLAGFQGAAPLAGSRGAAPPKEIYILRSQKGEIQGQNQVQCSKIEKKQEKQSVRADLPPSEF